MYFMSCFACYIISYCVNYFTYTLLCKLFIGPLCELFYKLLCELVYELLCELFYRLLCELFYELLCELLILFGGRRSVGLAPD